MIDQAAETKPFVWLSSFEMGIEEIDIEHRQLFESMNTLVDLAAQPGKAPLLEALLAHAVTAHKLHFVHEEALMARKNYPGLDAHALEHRRLESETDKLYTAFLSLPPQEGGKRRETVTKIRNALLDHLLHYDLAYKSHMMDARGL